MKIKKLKINAFGNLKEKEIELADHINIVQGNNESGKSTLLKFITNIFYGTSKNKKGKEFSDYDRYKPWSEEEFSGKLTYELEDGKQYEVFRDFKKKNPTIYNEKLEDISKQFTIDKTYGNQFFIEQTNIEEAMFYATLVSLQQEVKIDKNVQNALLQKVANLAGTGDDSISFKKAMEKINKKQVEEIGTLRTQGRPINVVKDEKFKLQDEIGELEEIRQRKQEIELEKAEKKLALSKLEELLKIAKKIKEEKEEEKLEQEKIKMKEELIQKQKEKEKQIEEQKEEYVKEKNKIYSKKELTNKSHTHRRNMAIVLFIIGVLGVIVNILSFKNTSITIAFLIEGIISFIWCLAEQKKQIEGKKHLQEKKERVEEIQRKIELLEAEEKVLQNNIEEQEKEIEKNKQKIEWNQKIEINNLIQNTGNLPLAETLVKAVDINIKLNQIEEERNRIQLSYHSLELEEKNLEPKLEKIALMEEKLQELNQKEKDLEQENEAIEMTKEILEIAYQKIYKLSLMGNINKFYYMRKRE